LIHLPSDLPYYVNTLIYGDPGVGKSEYVATYIDYLLKYQFEIKPMKVWLFDPVGKDMRYLRRGQASQFLDLQDGGTVARVVTGKEQQPLFEIEYFFDMIPQDLGRQGAPLSAYERFQQSLRVTDWSMYSAVCLDSLTGFRNAVLRVQQFKINRESGSGKQQHGMQWYGAAGLAIQNDVMATLACAPIHTFVTAHVDAKKDDARGFYMYAVAAPGQLSSGIASAFSEVYYLQVVTGEKGVRKRLLQTEQGMDATGKGEYIALSELQAPNFCEPSWEAVTSQVRG
jgi:hypothetical protein